MAAFLVLLVLAGYPLQLKPVARLPVGGSYTEPAVCGDFNQDGRSDIAFHHTETRGEWQVWSRRQGNVYALSYADTARIGLGVMAGQQIPLATGDFDQDGLPELLGLNFEFLDSIGTHWRVAAVLESPTRGSFPTRVAWYGRICYQCVGFGRTYYPGDLDRDGRPELLAMAHHGNGPRDGFVVFEFRRNDSAAFVWAGTDMKGSACAVADFDLDGRMEIATCGQDVVGTAECLGNDQYCVPPWRDTAPCANGFDVFGGRDVDQNGKPEFFIGFARYKGLYWERYLYGWEAVADNSYERFFIDSVPGGAGSRSMCGDIDGDGVQEIVWSVSNATHIYKSVAWREFERVFSWWNQGSAAIDIYDLNGNGYSEVVVGATVIDILEVEAIRLIGPNGGERLRAGDSCRVNWQTFNPPRCDSVSLFLRRDSTYRLDTIVTGLAPADTPYCWVVPDIRADSCWLMAIAYGPGWQYDESDLPLAIQPIGVGEERHEPIANRQEPMATVVRGKLFLSCRSDFQVANRGKDAAPTALLDACGRKVMTLRPGENDISHLVPGVYFIREHSGRQASTVSKVIVTR